MLSLLAKYIPGGVWTPAARVVAARRYGITDTTLVLTSIALEAGLSAISGVLVLLVGLLLVGPVSATIWPVALFGAVLVVLVHPRVFALWSRRLVRVFGVDEPPPVLSLRATLALLVVLLLHVGARRRRALVHRPLGRRSAVQVDPVPRRDARRSARSSPCSS